MSRSRRLPTCSGAFTSLARLSSDDEFIKKRRCLVGSRASAMRNRCAAADSPSPVPDAVNATCSPSIWVRLRSTHLAESRCRMAPGFRSPARSPRWLLRALDGKETRSFDPKNTPLDVSSGKEIRNRQGHTANGQELMASVLDDQHRRLLQLARQRGSVAGEGSVIERANHDEDWTVEPCGKVRCGRRRRSSERATERLTEREIVECGSKHALTRLAVDHLNARRPRALGAHDGARHE